MAYCTLQAIVQPVSTSLRYRVLSISVLVLAGLHALKGVPIGDFWEHAAVVKELARSPLDPLHPLFLTDDPHAFFSPYSLALALLSRYSGLSPADALRLAGPFNLAALLIALYRFPRAAGMPPATPFYAVILSLLLWGEEPWIYSGFLHAAAIGHVLAYPSTFALALSLVAFAIQIEIAERWMGRILLVCALSTIFLTHPPTAPFAVFGVLAFSWHTARKSPMGNVAVTALCALAAASAALAWPYYSILELTGGNDPGVHATNEWMYPGVVAFLQMTYPAFIVGLPVLCMRLRHDPTDPFALVFFGLAPIYLLGGATGAWAYGRVLPQMIFVLHLATAAWVASLEKRWFSVRSITGPQLAALAVVGALCALGAWQAAPVMRLYASLPASLDYGRRYAFLESHVDWDDVIMANPRKAYVIPAVAGRIVGTTWHRFGREASMRLAYTRRFFEPDLSDAERREILQRYCVGYLLLDSSSDTETLAPTWAWQLGTLIYNDDEVFLFRVPHGDEASEACSPRRGSS